MQRIAFALKMLWQHYLKLYDYLSKPTLQTKTLFQISPQVFKSTGIEVLILDYDGVLSGHAVEIPDANTLQWLKEAIRVFGETNIFILSNRPTHIRKQYFSDNFPTIHFIRANRKKPYPDGLLSILEKTKLLPEQHLLLDDRLLTGILAAILTNITALWVTAPMVNFKGHPIQECGFIFLRWLDKILIYLIYYFRKM